MPDQVRHDEQNLGAYLNCDTLSQAGIQGSFAGWVKCVWMPACAGMMNKHPDP
jgi:hypothetical protein